MVVSIRNVKLVFSIFEALIVEFKTELLTHIYDWAYRLAW